MPFNFGEGFEKRLQQIGQTIIEILLAHLKRIRLTCIKCIVPAGTGCIDLSQRTSRDGDKKRRRIGRLYIAAYFQILELFAKEKQRNKLNIDLRHPF
jgi:hypothetical protein